MTEERKIPIEGIRVDHVTGLTAGMNATRFGEAAKTYNNGAFKRGIDLDRILLDPDCEVFVLKRSTTETFVVSTLPEQEGLGLSKLITGAEFGGESNVVSIEDFVSKKK